MYHIPDMISPLLPEGEGHPPTIAIVAAVVEEAGEGLHTPSSDV
jgi:hypothetical protein